MNTAVTAMAALFLGSFFVSPAARENDKYQLSLRTKTVTKTALKPHPQVNQGSTDRSGKHGDQNYTIFEVDGSVYIEGSLLSWEGNDRTVSLALAIANTANQDSSTSPSLSEQVFTPSTMVVILPNGHSYRPFKREDVLRRAYGAEDGSFANISFGYEPEPGASAAQECSLRSDVVTCRTTGEQSAQNGNVVGFALEGEIKNALEGQDAAKYVKQVKEGYLDSRSIAAGTHVVGYVDFFVEDVHAGPFIVRIPAGDKTYDFVFGPELISFELPKKD